MDIVTFLEETRKLFLTKHFIRCTKGQSFARLHTVECDAFLNANIHMLKDIHSQFSSEEEFWFYLLRPSKDISDNKCVICDKIIPFELIKNGGKTCSKECRYKYSHSDKWKQSYKLAMENRTPEQREETKRKIKEKLENRTPEQREETKRKIKETCLKKYGVEHHLASKVVRDKIKYVKKERYGDEYFTNRDKAFETMNEKYGGFYNNREKIHQTWSNKSKEELSEIRNKIEKLCLEKYGTRSFLQTDDYRRKTKETCLKKYGVAHFSSSDVVKEKRKMTCRKLYGADNPFRSDIVRKKIENALFDKYGVIVPSKSPEIASKTRKVYFYDGIYFDSKYELYFYIYNHEFLKNDICRGRTFEYVFNDEKYIYHCDFFVNGEDVEIKGSHLFKDGTLYFPYRNDERIDWKYQQSKWNAKYKCMLDNNVHLILTDSEEMKTMIKIVDDRLTDDYVELFNVHAPFPYPNISLSDKSDFGIIRHFHKSIYSAHRMSKPSPIDGWNDKSLVKEIALNRLKYVGCCKPSDIIQGFNVTLKAPKVSVFEPKLGETLISKYLDDVDTICDPFSGFSGRLIASVNCGKRYFGSDINDEHVKESNELIQYKCYENCSVIQRDILMVDKIIHLKDAALFTCPPYGGKEHWNTLNDEVELSCDEWIKICLDKYKCKKYLFVVDKTEFYKDFVVDVITQHTHFGNRVQSIILIGGDANE